MGCLLLLSRQMVRVLPVLHACAQPCTRVSHWQVLFHRGHSEILGILPIQVARLRHLSNRLHHFARILVQVRRYAPLYDSLGGHFVAADALNIIFAADYSLKLMPLGLGLSGPSPECVEQRGALGLYSVASQEAVGRSRMLGCPAPGLVGAVPGMVSIAQRRRGGEARKRVYRWVAAPGQCQPSKSWLPVAVCDLSMQDSWLQQSMKHLM